MTNYKIILDEKKLSNFIDNFLPDCLDHEQYYVCLFARKKYCPSITNDKTQLVRKTSKKERLIHKIRQMECELGTYVQNKGPIPQEALALYINPNPRDLYKATLAGLKRFADLISRENKSHNPHQEILSCIQKSCSRKVWVDFDIDMKDPKFLVHVHDVLGKCSKCYDVLETQGGYHVLVQPNKVPKEVEKSWYRELAKDADIQGDCLIPVPGTSQGGFMPHFIDQIIT